MRAGRPPPGCRSATSTDRSAAGARPRRSAQRTGPHPRPQAAGRSSWASGPRKTRTSRNAPSGTSRSPAAAGTPAAASAAASGPPRGRSRRGRRRPGRLVQPTSRHRQRSRAGRMAAVRRARLTRRVWRGRRGRRHQRGQRRMLLVRKGLIRTGTRPRGLLCRGRAHDGWPGGGPWHEGALDWGVGRRRSAGSECPRPAVPGPVDDFGHTVLPVNRPLNVRRPPSGQTCN